MLIRFVHKLGWNMFRKLLVVAVCCAGSVSAQDVTFDEIATKNRAINNTMTCEEFFRTFQPNAPKLDTALARNFISVFAIARGIDDNDALGNFLFVCDGDSGAILSERLRANS